MDWPSRAKPLALEPQTPEPPKCMSLCALKLGRLGPRTYCQVPIQSIVKFEFNLLSMKKYFLVLEENLNLQLTSL